MKTIKTVLAILFLIAGLTSTAQEKQNDATWEETIEWIQTFGITYGYDDFEKNGRGNWITDINTSDKSFSLVQIAEGPDALCLMDDDRYLEINKIEGTCFGFYKIYSAEITEMTYKIDRNFNFIVFKSPKSTRAFYFDKSNDELFERCQKAFEHLFYLSGVEVKIVDKTELGSKF